MAVFPFYFLQMGQHIFVEAFLLFFIQHNQLTEKGYPHPSFYNLYKGKCRGLLLAVNGFCFP